MASDISGFDISKEYEWFKTAPVGVRKPSNPLSEGIGRHWIIESKKAYPGILTGRDLLQRLGTDCMRKRDPDFWVNEFLKRVEANQGYDIVNADCRFMNEVNAIRSLPMEHKFIFCDYHSPRYTPGGKHESEALANKLLQLGFTDGQEIDFSKIPLGLL